MSGQDLAVAGSGHDSAQSLSPPRVFAWAIRVGFQDLAQFGRQPRVFIRVALLHFSQLRNRPDDAPRLDLLDSCAQADQAHDDRRIMRSL
jgi:hypothetical protein